MPKYRNRSFKGIWIKEGNGALMVLAPVPLKGLNKRKFYFCYGFLQQYVEIKG